VPDLRPTPGSRATCSFGVMEKLERMPGLLLTSAADRIARGDVHVRSVPGADQRAHGSPPWRRQGLPHVWRSDERGKLNPSAVTLSVSDLRLQLGDPF
jgi:hypothetical protein